ncbi:hypothetical protein AEQ67_04025 [Pseudomonas sp. RIT-PI-q]|nr:hypothetical protein AEQ67_04025 [Pseudomonas sp. RIT-PI-q]
MNPRLVLDFNVHIEVVKEAACGNDHFVLGLPRLVFIKVKNVVVLDAPIRGTAGLMIPDRLKKTARRQQTLVQAKRRQAPDQLGVDRVGHGDLG